MAAMTNTNNHRENDHQREVGRCYTRARRLPLMIGRLPGSDTALWGGPYTVTQVVVACSTAVVLWWTKDVWAVFGVGWNGATLLGAPLGMALLVRRARIEGRDPLRVGLGVASAAAAPARGRTITGTPWSPNRGARVPAAPVSITNPRTMNPAEPVGTGGADANDNPTNNQPTTGATPQAEANRLDGRRALEQLDEDTVDELLRAALWLRKHGHHGDGGDTR